LIKSENSLHLPLYVADSGIWRDGNPRPEAERAQRAGYGGEQEGVREAGVSDEDDWRDTETAAVVPRRLLQHHSQTSHLDLQRAGTGAAHLRTADVRHRRPPHQHRVSQVPGDVASGS